MSAKIFISYRRDDSAGHAGRVTDRLEREFGRDLLFMDVDAIPLGTNFVKVNCMRRSPSAVRCSRLLDRTGSMYAMTKETVAWTTRTTSCASRLLRRCNGTSP